MATKGWIGQLRQAKDGKHPWVCEYTCPLSGKRKQRKIAEAGANKKDRERLYQDFRHSLTDGRMITRENATFGDALDVYRKRIAERREANDQMEAGTQVRIDHAIKHLRKDLGSVLLKDITSPMVQTYIYQKSKSYRALHFELYQQIKSTLQQAVWDELISISPLDVKKIRLPQRPRSTRKIPTIEQGINLLDGWLYVQHSLSRHGGLKGPKRPSRHRYVMLSREMNHWLTETAKRDGYPRTGHMLKPEPGNRNPNWTTEEGNHLLRSMTSQFQAAQVRLGFVDDDGKALWTMHEMRHYAGSMWLETGVPIEQVSRMLGHSKIETTQKYYIHFFEKQSMERDRQAMVRVSELHQLPTAPPPAALAGPMRDSCEIGGEVIDID